jgi:hypothetical protein
MFRRGSPLVKEFNQIITERSRFITAQLIDKKLLFQQECADHLFPQDADVTTIFTPLGVKAVFFSVFNHNRKFLLKKTVDNHCKSVEHTASVWLARFMDVAINHSTIMFCYRVFICKSFRYIFSLLLHNCQVFLDQTSILNVGHE